MQNDNMGVFIMRCYKLICLMLTLGLVLLPVTAEARYLRYEDGTRAMTGLKGQPVQTEWSLAYELEVTGGVEVDNSPAAVKEFLNKFDLSALGVDMDTEFLDLVYDETTHRLMSIKRGDTILVDLEYDGAGNLSKINDRVNQASMLYHTAGNALGKIDKILSLAYDPATWTGQTAYYRHGEPGTYDVNDANPDKRPTLQRRNYDAEGNLISIEHRTWTAGVRRGGSRRKRYTYRTQTFDPTTQEVLSDSYVRDPQRSNWEPTVIGKVVADKYGNQFLEVDKIYMEDGRAYRPGEMYNVTQTSGRTTESHDISIKNYYLIAAWDSAGVTDIDNRVSVGSQIAITGYIADTTFNDLTWAGSPRGWHSVHEGIKYQGKEAAIFEVCAPDPAYVF